MSYTIPASEVFLAARDADRQQAAALLAGLHAPGAFQRVRVISHPAPAAAHRRAGVVLAKEWTAVVRSGVDYARLAENDGRETGPLAWGQWALFPVLIEHRGGLYVRLYLTTAPVVTYRVSGQPVARTVFESYLVPSQRDRERPTGGTITAKVSGVTLY